MRARFDNPGEQLFPNQFVNVRLTLQTLPGALSVPVDVVQFGNQGNYVYVVRDGKAHIQTVKLGASASDRVQVVDGLQAGEQVVLEGMDSLRDGSRVKIVAPVEGDPDALLGGLQDEGAGKPAPVAGHAAPAGGNAESAGGNVGPTGEDAQSAGNAQPAGDAGPGGDAPPEP